MSWGVNLGSLAVSRVLLDALSTEFADLVDDTTARIDWDPYMCRALLCGSQHDWDEVVEGDVASGARGARELTQRYPGFFARIQRARDRLEHCTRRSLEIHAVDFGEALWIDMGLHESLRRFFDDLVADSPRGSVVRALSGLGDVPRDDRANILVDSQIAHGADVSSSIVLDSIIEDGNSLMGGGVVIKGIHGRLMMPHGGVSLFSSVRDMSFEEPRAISLGSVAAELSLGSGMRHATLLLGERALELSCLEDTSARDGQFYTKLIPGNAVSFEEAARLVGAMVAEGNYAWPRPP
jgi:hypothetical protein